VLTACSDTFGVGAQHAVPACSFLFDTSATVSCLAPHALVGTSSSHNGRLTPQGQENTASTKSDAPQG
jgi:hypothetical protein